MKKFFGSLVLLLVLGLLVPGSAWGVPSLGEPAIDDAAYTLPNIVQELEKTVNPLYVLAISPVKKNGSKTISDKTEISINLAGERKDVIFNYTIALEWTVIGDPSAPEKISLQNVNANSKFSTFLQTYKHDTKTLAPLSTSSWKQVFDFGRPVGEGAQKYFDVNGKGEGEISLLYNQSAKPLPRLVFTNLISKLSVYPNRNNDFALASSGNFALEAKTKNSWSGDFAVSKKSGEDYYFCIGHLYMTIPSSGKKIYAASFTYNYDKGMVPNPKAGLNIELTDEMKTYLKDQAKSKVPSAK